MKNNLPDKIFLYTFLIFINLAVYFPSFFDSARGTDHQLFLSKISQVETLPELIKESYSFNRAESPGKGGDKLLFIPIIFMLLAFEKWLFGYDFFWWQITGFLLHLLAQWSLLRVLNAFVFSRWSFFVVLLSSVLFLQQELVVRHHLNGYLLFQIFALTAIYEFIKYFHAPSKNKKHFIAVLIWLTLATFAYAGGLLINGLFIAILFFPWKTTFDDFPNRHKILIFLPMITYLGTSVIDFLLRVKNFSYETQGLTGAIQPQSFDMSVFLVNMTNLTKIGLQGLFFPAFTKIKFIADQYHYDTFTWSLNNFPEVLNAGLIIFCSALLVFCIFSGVKNAATIKSFSNPRMVIVGMFGIFFAVFYMVLLCFLRLQTNPEYLNTVPHHLYIIYSFFIIGLFYLALPFLLFIDKHRLGIKNALCLILISFSFLQGYFLYQLNNNLRVLWEPQRIFLRQIQHFVNENKETPDFSFTIFKSELLYNHVVYLSETKVEFRSLVEMLFPKYFNKTNPTYYVIYTKKEGLRSFKKRTDAEEYFQEMITKNNPWHPDIYIGGRKINNKLFFIKSQFPELYNQIKQNPNLFY